MLGDVDVEDQARPEDTGIHWCEYLLAHQQQQNLEADLHANDPMHL
jgi:hypothetical protein